MSLLSKFGIRASTVVEEPLLWGETLLKTTNAYSSLVKVNGVPFTENENYMSGNYRTVARLENYIGNTLGISRTRWNQISYASTQRGYIVSGTQTYTLTGLPPSGYYILFGFEGGGLTSSAIIGDFRINFGGVFRTMQECVDAGFIEPMVLLSSSRGNQYIWTTLLPLLDGGNTNSFSYPTARLLLKLKPGQSFTQFRLYANKSFNTSYDGYEVYSYNPSQVEITVL